MFQQMKLFHINMLRDFCGKVRTNLKLQTIFGPKRQLMMLTTPGQIHASRPI